MLFKKTTHFLKKPSSQTFISLMAGATLVLAFAPINLYIFAFLAPAVFYWLLQDKTPKRAAWLGWCFGLGQFGCGVSWVYVSIHVYGFTPIPIAMLFTGLFVSTLALFPLLQAFMLARYFPQNSTVKLILVYPSSWVLIEWVRSWIFTGFPWLLIAYTQVDSPFKGYIPILGEFGVGFMVVLSGALVIYALRHKSCPGHMLGAVLMLAGIIAGGFFLSNISWTRPLGKPKSVALVQGNIPQSIKWDPESAQAILKIYYDLTASHWQNKIIIWPEGAVPIPETYALPFLDQMGDLAKLYHASLLTGIPVQVGNSFSYYNALIALGEGRGHYYKRYLVPFGEYVPMENVLRGLMGFFSLPMSSMISGPNHQPDLKAEEVIFAPFICYEIAYAEALLQQAPRSNVLLTVSDDAWFGNSLAPGQHLQIGQFRAIESGRDLLFASNDGITAIVNDRGQITKKLPQFVRAVLQGTFQPRTGKTPWLCIGNIPLILLLLLVLLVCSICGRKRSCRS